MNIPDIVKQHVLKHCKRMPETQEEVDQYLDLINHLKEYETAVILNNALGKKFLNRFGIDTPNDVKANGKKLFGKQ